MGNAAEMMQRLTFAVLHVSGTKSTSELQQDSGHSTEPAGVMETATHVSLSGSK